MQGLKFHHLALGRAPGSVDHGRRAKPSDARCGFADGRRYAPIGRRLSGQGGGIGWRGAIARQRAPHGAAAGITQNAQDVRNMIAHREMRQAKLAADFLVRKAAEQIVENFALAIGERRGRYSGTAHRVAHVAIDIELRQVDDFRAGEGGLYPRNDIAAAVPRYGDQHDGAVFGGEAIHRRQGRRIE